MTFINKNSLLSEALCVELANYMLTHSSTVRETARYFGMGKSTVHKRVTKTLARINKPLYLNVRKLLNKNKAERHLRGGEATKIKFSQIRVAE